MRAAGSKMQSRLWRDQHDGLLCVCSAGGLEDSSSACEGPQDPGGEEIILVRRPKRAPR